MQDLRTTLTQLTYPLLFRVDYKSVLWSADKDKAEFWLIASAGITIGILFILGQLSALEFMLAILFPAVFWKMPPTLSFSVAALNVSLAFASFFVIVSLLLLGASTFLVQTGAYLVQLWGGLALISMVLGYIRTAKSEMP